MITRIIISYFQYENYIILTRIIVKSLISADLNASAAQDQKTPNLLTHWVIEFEKPRATAWYLVLVVYWWFTEV